MLPLPPIPLPTRTTNHTGIGTASPLHESVAFQAKRSWQGNWGQRNGGEQPDPADQSHAGRATGRPQLWRSPAAALRSVAPAESHRSRAGSDAHNAATTTSDPIPLLPFHCQPELRSTPGSAPSCHFTGRQRFWPSDRGRGIGGEGMHQNSHAWLNSTATVPTPKPSKRA